MITRRHIGTTLINTAFDQHQHIRVRVNGTSMHPLMQVDDHVWVERVRFAALQPGDVITLWHDGGLLTHRVLKINSGGCVTKGDNCGSGDAPMAADVIVGRVVAVERHDRWIKLDRRRWQVLGRWVARLSRAQAALVQHRRRWVRATGVIVRAAMVSMLYILSQTEDA